jgi:hypothetical protein
MSDEEYDEEVEESITGYDPASDSYVVEDRYELVTDPTAELWVEYANPAIGGMPKLDDASFVLIRRFELSEGDRKIDLKKVLIDGEFKVGLKPDVVLRPTGYVRNTEPDPRLFSSSEVSLTDLYAFHTPTVTIKGKFRHQESERLYEVTIEAFVTQDLPGSFFTRPLKDATYSFISTDVTIRPAFYAKF